MRKGVNNILSNVYYLIKSILLSIITRYELHTL